MLDGLVAVVSGSSSGIGRAIAERFAAEGAGVLVNSVRSVDDGTALARSLPDAAYVQADVSDEVQARTLVDTAVERWGRLDILVNNAGGADIIDHRDLDAVTDDVWQRNLSLNGMYSPGADGSGVTAYIIDTGIRFSHNEFRGRATSGRCWMSITRLGTWKLSQKMSISSRVASSTTGRFPAGPRP